MMPRNFVMAALMLCVGCAGHAASKSNDRANGDLGGLDEAGASADPDAASRGGSSGTSAPALAEAGIAGELFEAGAPGYIPFIESGTRTCPNSEYCFGQACYAPPSFEPSVCVSRCESDVDCAPYEACIGTAKLESTCYARCNSPSDCAYHFDCLDFSGGGKLICFPALWAGRRDELGN